MSFGVSSHHRCGFLITTCQGEFPDTFSFGRRLVFLYFSLSLFRLTGNYTMKYTRHFLFSMTLLLSFLCLAADARAEWGSFIINFEKNLYGSGAQTWQIASYDDTWTYFANRKGMVQFNGDEWSLFPLNNGADVRSVLASQTRQCIYAGGINEFGYFVPAEDGMLAYHCMSDSLDGAFRYIGNVWNIHENGDVLYFQGDSKVVRLSEGRYSSVGIPQTKLECSAVIGGVLYVGTNRGVWFLVGDTFFPLPGGETLASLRIRGMVPYGEGMLVATAYDGLFYYSDDGLVPFRTGAETFLHENELFCMAVRDSLIALGTIHQGVALVDTSARRVKCFNELNGLQDNTVLSVAFDRQGNLWTGMDSGIDLICLHSPFTNLYSNPNSHGAGYAAAIEGSFLYLGTNRGLYYTSYPVLWDTGFSDIRPVAGLSGQVWNLCRIGKEIFCLHDRGLFRIRGNKAERLTDMSGVWSCQLVKGRTDRMYVGAYDGMYLLERDAAGWKVVCKIDGILDSGRLFVQETDRILWISVQNHVVRVELSADLSRAVDSRSYMVGEGMLSHEQVFLALVKDVPCFVRRGGIWRFNSRERCMEPAEDLNALLGNASSACNWLQEHNGYLLAMNGHGISRVSLDRQGADLEVIPIRRALVELVPGFETLIPVADSLFIVPNEKGFALWSSSVHDAKEEAEARSDVMRIKRMTLSYPKDSLVYSDNFLNRRPHLDIAYSLNSVRFDYGLSFLVPYDDVRFQYRLNDEAWADPTFISSKEYTDLPAGDYRFEVKALFPDGTSDTDAITFRILSPWYRTWVAYLCYLLCCIFLIYLLYCYEERRLRHKEMLVAEEKDREMHQLEKEYEEERERRERQIMQLEKEKLEHDLRHKSQEMANLMINFARKNEMLTEMKGEILRISSLLKGENTREGKTQLMKLGARIDANIQSDDLLKRIEEQFDLIHNDFMKNLQAKHPDLSPNERMMCAYLKMNLSTKEIAPLLNISVRGVETVRYRIRKKFGLEREESLVDYLNRGI